LEIKQSDDDSKYSPLNVSNSNWGYYTFEKTLNLSKHSKNNQNEKPYYQNTWFLNYSFNDKCLKKPLSKHEGLKFPITTPREKLTN
ncbi:hypothetical protein NL476_27855, partial [Klebsiella pneumoniae]|nr:hypothetical protein [Klebsiella pneumoniae]